MKEATGEASMTGITIGIIALISLIAVPIVRNIINDTTAKTCCSSLGGEYSGSGSTAVCAIKTASGSTGSTTTGTSSIKALCKSEA